MKKSQVHPVVKMLRGPTAPGESLLQRIGRGRDKPKVEIDWSRSRFIELPIDRHPKPMNLKDARKRVPLLLEQEAERIECLSDFLSDNGLRFGKDDESLRNMEEFALHNLYCNSDFTDIQENWADFIVNFAYLLGSIMIERSISGKLKWSVTDYALKKFGEPPRFEYVITGYGMRALQNNIFNSFLWSARAVVKNKGFTSGMFLCELKRSDYLES